MAYSGFFRPTNPTKYTGRVDQIVFRSLWELKYFQKLDQQPDVVEWSSEELMVQYVSPVDNRTHRYFPDCKFTVRQPDGTLRKFLVEIKPHKETLPPTRKTPVRSPKAYRRLLEETNLFMVNQAKWAAAKAWCRQQGYEFVVLTERDLFGTR